MSKSRQQKTRRQPPAPLNRIPKRKKGNSGLALSTRPANPPNSSRRSPRLNARRININSLRNSNSIMEPGELPPSSPITVPLQPPSSAEQQQAPPSSAAQQQAALLSNLQEPTGVITPNPQQNPQPSTPNVPNPQQNPQPSTPNVDSVNISEQINNAHNTNNPSQSDLLENHHVSPPPPATTNIPSHLYDEDNDTLMENHQQQLDQQHLVNAIRASQPFQDVLLSQPSARHVRFQHTQTRNPTFSFHGLNNAQSDSDFMSDFNTLTDPHFDASHGATQGISPQNSQYVPPEPFQNYAPSVPAFVPPPTPSKDSLLIQCLTKIVKQLDTKKPPSQYAKQIHDILGHDVRTFLLSQTEFKGFSQQRLHLSSNRAYRDSKNLAPSQKKVQSLSTVADILAVIQTMCAVKSNYLLSLIRKLSSQKKDLNIKLDANTLTYDDIFNYLNDSLLLVKLLFGEHKDINLSLGKLADQFAFSKIKDSNYVFPAAYQHLIKSYGRTKISTCLDTAGIYDCILKAEVSNRLKPTTTKKNPPKKTFLPKCKFINCTNFNKNHRSSYYHPKKDQSQVQQQAQAPEAAIVPKGEQ